ncbi:uncharacterized protein PRCAT00003087001 [Priceomyces carsonii]|uniref:uncharacterized protein n=1 Tax=Priceomyces carsonii TaxID=28549 RepID=UPI002ED9F15E|nr:unnamed protein product [Priceomyces carsonii]
MAYHVPVYSIERASLSNRTLSPKNEPRVAIDPITLMINECMTISSAMRKMTRWSQSGVAAILGAGDFFGEDDPINNLASNLSNNSRPDNDNPLLSSFLQLRTILTEAQDLYELDSLTLLQPFLLVVKSSSISGHITALSLNAISKFLDYDIISLRSKNIQSTLVQIISSLTHCRFEAADQDSDDSVLLKVLRLLESIITSPLSNFLPNEVIFEVILTCLLPLACNKRRSEVLRRAAEMAMSSITVRLFSQLRSIEPEPIEDLRVNFQDTQLPEDVIGGTESHPSVVPTPGRNSEEDVSTQISNDENVNTNEKAEEPFGIICINDYLGILISMISPSNQYQHMESTRVFAFALINTAIEVSGLDIPKHSSLMSLVADPVSKHVLQTITTTDSPALLQASLQLFSTIAIVLGRQLKSQVELTFTLLFKSILPESKKAQNDMISGELVTTRISASKEMLLESLSLLWTRSPVFFTHLFIDYDCDFDRSDLSTKTLQFLCQLSLPESALITTDNVPPICLEGILSFISGVNDRIKSINLDLNSVPLPDLIKNRNQKTIFIECTKILNENPKEGIKALADKGFISNNEDISELAKFFFTKSGRLNKKVLGEFLAKPKNSELLRSFIALFDFTDLRVDEALRILLRTFRLPGESQQIERVVELFAERYVSCQNSTQGDSEKADPEIVRPDRDSVFVLSYSIILLNTDLHNPQVKRQMLLDDYKRNLRGVYNGKDFPEWYLAKIYLSIKDREIIMPEEHHGTNKWFDDAWHNMISSTPSAIQNETAFTAIQLCQFDKVLFESVIENIIETLVRVFKEATDDHIITRLMSTIDKCANICIYHSMSTSLDKLIGLLADLTSLTDLKSRNSTEDSRDKISITQIKIEKKEEAVTVSELAVWFGKDFKAQLSIVVLFRLIKKSECRITSAWEKVIRIILSLFENCLVNPNLFLDFQGKLKLSPLPKVKPRYIITRSKLTNAGIFSTFSSFLKGYSDDPPEPSDQEIESTLSTMDCIASINIASIFTSISRSKDLNKFVELLLDALPKYSEDKKRYFESETLFLLESCVCFCLLLNDLETKQLVLSRLSTQDLSRKGQLRVITYKLLLARKCETDVDSIITEIITLDKDTLTKNGSQLVQPFISLVDDDSWCSKKLLNDENYWKVLRIFGSLQLHASEVLLFVESLIKQSSNEVNINNYMLILGLLDEISSLGAMASQWEQESDTKSESKSEAKDDSQNNTKDDAKDDKDDAKMSFYVSLVKISKSSITLTADLAPLSRKSDFYGKDFFYSLMQALAHQCFNPCRAVRSYALSMLQVTALSLELNDELTPQGTFEYVLFPLLTELSKNEVLESDTEGFMETHIAALSLISKVFLKFSAFFKEGEIDDVWLEILNYFITFNDLSEKYNGKLKESGSEILKNMILVLQNGDILKENTDLWDSTWSKIDLLYPTLKSELIVTVENEMPKISDTKFEAPDDSLGEVQGDDAA